MSALNFVDRYVGTLASGYTSGGSSLSITSATSASGSTVLPSGACHYFMIIRAEGSNTEEVVLVTNRSGTTLTITGAQDNTSPSDHGSGAVIIASIMGADAFSQLKTDALDGMSGDATSSSGVVTVGKVHGVTYGASPSTNTVPVVTGSNTVTYEAVPNAALANSSVTVNGTSISLGSSGTITAAPSSGLVYLDEVTVGTAVSTITFSSISGSYKDLVIRIWGRADSNPDNDVYMQVNGATGSNYDYSLIASVDNTAVAVSATSVSNPPIGKIPGSGAIVGFAGLTDIIIPAYTSTAFFHCATSQSGCRGGNVFSIKHWWGCHSSSAITSITFGLPSGVKFENGTVATLWGRY